jgi:hypothetical protein
MRASYPLRVPPINERMRRDRRLSTRCCGGHTRGRIFAVPRTRVPAAWRTDILPELAEILRHGLGVRAAWPSA